MTNPTSRTLGDVLPRENVRLFFPEVADVGLSIRTFDVVEGLNQLFEAVLTCVSTNEDYDLSALCGARLSFELSGHVERAWRGICSEARFARVSEAGDGLATYVVTLVPDLWRLTQRIQNRLFQHQNIPAIVQKILDEWAIDYEWRIDAAKYPAVELRTQYGETDYAFISRLLEEAGISFFFVDMPERASRLVLTDAPERGKERGGPPIPFVDDVSQAQRAATPQYVTRIELVEKVKPGLVTARDYDFMRPRMPMYAQARAQRPNEHHHEQYHFTPGVGLSELSALDIMRSGQRFAVADDIATARTNSAFAQQRTERALDALHSDRRVIHYEASVNDLSPGVVFRIGRHPRTDLRDDQSLLCIRHRASGKIANPDSWLFAGHAVSTNAVYRPPHITPKPRIFGVQTAIVVGKENISNQGDIRIPGVQSVLSAAAMNSADDVTRDNMVYVDEHGRVRVQFPWDREHGFDRNSSMWMRVSQGWAGAGHGLFTIPRVGHEVLVAFLDGDPDCPIIVGRVHNMKDPVPYPLPAAMTVSTWKTASTPTGEGFNELRFDDASGKEHVYLQAEKDMDQLVKNDIRQAVGGNATQYVQKHDVRTVGGSQSTMVNLSEQHAVGLDQAQFVGLHRTTHIGVEDNTLVGTRWGVTIARSMTDRLVQQLDQVAGSVGNVLRNAATTVLGGITQTPTASPAASPLAEMGGQLFEGLKSALETVKGYAMDPGPPPTSIEMVDRQIKLTTGEASIVLDGPNVTIQAQGNIVLHAMDHVSVLSEKEIAIGGREKVAVVSATNDVILQAKQDLHLNPFSEGKAPREATRIGRPQAVAIPIDKCLVCEGAITIGEWGKRSCASAAGSLAGLGGGSLPIEENAGSGASAAGITFAEEILNVLSRASRSGFKGDIIEHAASIAVEALGSTSPSFWRVLTWLAENRHIHPLDRDSLMMDSSSIKTAKEFIGLQIRWWAPLADEPQAAQFAVHAGDMPRNLPPIDQGRIAFDICLPLGSTTTFFDQAALTELSALFLASMSARFSLSA
ncbi:MAG TPA: type VI secretion system tip protein TssI/VgrG, partial [Polyangium sp.]|nr:type VI secretion system tip protein TssI/VgrG [Polyangium sp.]